MKLKKLFTKKGMAWSLGTLVGLYLILMGLVGPWYLKSKLVPELSEDFQLETSIEKLNFNPFINKLTIENLSAKHADEELVGLGKLIVNVDLWQIIWEKGVFLDEVYLENPRAYIEILEDKSLALLKLLPPPSEELEEASHEEESEFVMPLVEIVKLSISKGYLRFKDSSNATPFTHEIKDINFDLPEFSTREELNNHHELLLATSGGMSLKWSGDIQFNPLSSHGQVTIEDFHFAPLAPYYDRLVHVDVPSGKLGMIFNYDLNLKRESRKIKFSWDEITIEDFEARDRESGHIVQSLDFLQMRKINWDLLASSFVIDEIEFKGGELNAVRRADESLNLLPRATLEEAKEESPVEVAEADSSNADDSTKVDFKDNLRGAIRSLVWHLTTVWKHSWASAANKVILDGYKISVRDEFITPAVELNFENIHVEVDGLKSDEGSEIDLAIRFDLDQIDQVFTGHFSLFPLAGKLSTDLNQFSLSRFNPYIKQWSEFSLNTGSLSLDTQSNFRVNLKSDGEKEIALTTDFNLQVDGFDLTQKTEDLSVNFNQLQVNKGHFELDPQSLHISEILLKEPKGFFKQKADVQKEEVVKQHKSASTSGKEKPQKALVDLFQIKKVLPWDLQLAKIKVENGQFELRDETLFEELNLVIQELNTEITNFSSLEQCDVALKLAATIEDFGEFNYDSHFLLNSPEVNGAVDISLRSLPLSSLSPYGITFTHYPLSDGNFSFNVSNTIVKNKLDGVMGVKIKSIELGEYVKADDRAMDVPLKFGISLLQDASRKIEFKDIAIHGDLSDPKFRLWGVIWKVLKTVCVKAVSSPFKYLTSLVGSSSDELESLVFPYGQAVASSALEKKLLKVAQALKERPSLKLSVFSYGLNEKDVSALKEAKFEATYAKYLAAKKEVKQDIEGADTEPTNTEPATAKADLPAKVATETAKSVSDLVKYYYELNPSAGGKPESKKTKRVRKLIKVGRVRRYVYVDVKDSSSSDQASDANSSEPKTTPLISEGEARAQLIKETAISELEKQALVNQRLESLKKLLASVGEDRLLIKQEKSGSVIEHFKLTIEP
jgi:hypothetical protein